MFMSEPKKAVVSENFGSNNELVQSDVVNRSDSNLLNECRKRKIETKQILPNLPKKQRNSEVEGGQESDSDYGLRNLFASDEKEQKSSKRKHKNQKNNNDSNKKKENERPNYFLSIRIKNPKIHEKVAAIQNHIRKEMKIMENCFVPTPTLHLTLFVMSLSGDEDKQKAIDAMTLSTSELTELLKNFNDLELNFEKLGTFGGQVVFVSLSKNGSLSILNSIVDILQTSFREMNVNVKNDHETFTPHLTVMKMSRCMRIMRKAGIRRIPAKLYKDYKDDSFGTDVMSEIQLCSMNDEKDDEGFYKVIAKMKIGDPVTVEVTHPKFNVIDLSSYDVLFAKKDNDKNESDKEFDSSWDNITENDVKQALSSQQNDCASNERNKITEDMSEIDDV